jgi:hypothetical protein
MVASCAAPTRSLSKPKPSRATELAPGISLVTSIPLDTLTTSGDPVLDEEAPCRTIPPKVVTAAGFADPPVLAGGAGCMWVSQEGVVTTISSMSADPMAEEVAEHIQMARETGETRYLSWLKIDGQYALERILHVDEASTCTVIVDMNAPQTVSIMTYLANVETGEAIPTDATESVRTLCPTSRKVAQNLVRHFLQ